MTASERIAIPSDQIADFCREHGVRKLAVFGSVLRDDFRPRSDVDVLVDFEPETHIGYFGIVRMERELSRMLGRRVDLRTPAELSKYFRQRVLDEAEVVYERE